MRRGDGRYARGMSELDDGRPQGLWQGQVLRFQRVNFADELARQREAIERIDACEHDWLEPLPMVIEGGREGEAMYCGRCRTTVWAPPGRL